MTTESAIVPVERIQQFIYVIRGHKVILDSDLAELYGVKTRVLNQVVKRNIDRFPEDFMFQLSDKEAEHLRSQIVTSKRSRGGCRFPTLFHFCEYTPHTYCFVLFCKLKIV
jgi:hypothetical protein